MKKRTGIIFTIALSLCLVACGNDNTQESGSIQQQTQNEQTQNEQIQNEQTSEGLTSNIESPANDNNLLDDEFANANMYDSIIRINDTVIKLPCAPQKFIDAGAVDTNSSINALVEPHYDYSFFTQVNSKKVFFFYDNDSEQRATLSDLETLKQINNNGAQNVYYPKEIHVDSTLSELYEAWGEPTYETYDLVGDLVEVYLDMPTFVKSFGLDNPENLVSATNKSYRVTISHKDQKISSIDATYGLDYKPADFQTVLKREECEYTAQYPDGSINMADLNDYYKSLFIEHNGKTAVITFPGMDVIGNNAYNYKRIGAAEDAHGMLGLTTNGSTDANLEIIEDSDNLIKAFSYSIENGVLLNKCIYIDDEYEFGFYINYKMLDDGEFDEEMISYCKTYTTDFVRSFRKN